MYHYKLRSSLHEWSPNIRWVNTKFLATATNALVGTATADFSVQNPLTRHKDFLFKQRKGFGQVAGLGLIVTNRMGQYVLFMITRVNHYARIKLDNVINCVCELKEICLNRSIKL